MEIPYVPDPKHRIVYEDEHILVESNQIESDTTVITFTHASPASPGFPFGVSFLAGLGLHGVFFCKKKNNWWESPKMDEAMKVVEASLKPGSRRITYGSSMGGFGSLAFATQLGCDTVIAMGPQATIDPQVVPWETRYKPEDDLPGFTLGNAGDRLSPGQTIYLIYDDLMDDDLEHARMIDAAGTARGAVIKHFRVGLGGHPCARVLTEAGMLKPMIKALMLGLPYAFRDEYRRNRRRSVTFCRRFLDNEKAVRKHPVLMERAVRRFWNHHRSSREYLTRYASFLEKLGHIERAIQVLSEGLALCEEPTGEMRISLARLFSKQGELRLACQCYQKIVQDFPQQATPAVYALWAGTLRQLGLLPQAGTTLESGFARFETPHPVLMVEHARLAVAQKNPEQIRARWQAVLDHSPAHLPAEGYDTLSNIHLEAGDFDAAEAVLNLGNQHLPKHRGVARKHARMPLLRGQWDEAVQRGRSVLERFRKSVKSGSYLDLAQAHRELGAWEEAEAVLQQGLERYPGDPELEAARTLVREK